MTPYEYLKACFILSACFMVGLFVKHALPLVDDLAVQEPIMADKTYHALSGLQTALEDVHAIEIDTQRTEAEMAGLLNQTRHSMMTPAQTKQLVDQATLLMVNLNATTLRLDEAAKQYGEIPPVINQAIERVMQDTHATMEASQETLDAATADLEDPAIKDSLANVEETTKQTAETAANVESASKDVANFAHRELAPARGVKNTLKAVLDWAFRVRGATGF